MRVDREDMDVKLYHDNFQNYKKYGIPKAQLVIADIPYNIGADAYGSNPMWYNGGDNSNGESKFAKKSFFNSDGYFKIAEYMHFCSRLLKPEPKQKGKAPAMIVFCAFDQIQTGTDSKTGIRFSSARIIRRKCSKPICALLGQRNLRWFFIVTSSQNLTTVGKWTKTEKLFEAPGKWYSIGFSGRGMGKIFQKSILHKNR